MCEKLFVGQIIGWIERNGNLFVEIEWEDHERSIEPAPMAKHKYVQVNTFTGVWYWRS